MIRKAGGYVRDIHDSIDRKLKILPKVNAFIGRIAQRKRNNMG